MKIYVRWSCFMLGLALTCGTGWSSEPGCYESPSAAAAQTGPRGAQGFRVDSTLRDGLSGSVWASVRTCGHPERPRFLVLAALGNLGLGLASGMARRSESSATRTLVMLAGSRVQVVEISQGVRIEMPAIAQTSGAVGDRMRARVIPVTSIAGDRPLEAWVANERIVTGTVRSGNLLEVDVR